MTPQKHKFHRGKTEGIGTKNSDAFGFHITSKQFYKAAMENND